MKKALLFLPTFLIGLASWSLPKLNSAHFQADKIIKAAQITHFGHVAFASIDSLVQPKGNYEVRTVVIDPGHGGHDPGCLGARSKEKHHCLAIGKYLAEALKKNYPGLNIIMTRSTDVFIPLNERAAIATRNKADLFISIHCNFIPKASHVHGTETYVLGLHATQENLEVAKRENAAILLEDNYQETYGYDPNSAEGHILMSMFQNAFLAQSISFAEKVQQYASSHSSRRNKGVKQAGFLVLRYATMPSVLVETGYLSNATEEDYLRSEEGQRSMANSILMAFADYKAEMEGIETPPLVFLDEKEQGEPEPVELAVDKKEKPAPMSKIEEAVAIPVKAETPPLAKAETKPELPAKNTAPKRNENLKTNEAPSHVQVNKPATPPPAPPKAETKTPPASKILASTPLVSEPPVSASQNTDIQFRVQLAASPQLLDVTAGKWMNVPYLIEVVEESKLYKYQVRNFASLEEADQAKEKLRRVGFNDAFVVAYQNGARVDPKKLVK